MIILNCGGKKTFFLVTMSSLVFRSNQCSASLNADFTLLYFTLLCRFYKFLVKLWWWWYFIIHLTTLFLIIIHSTFQKNSNNFQMSTYIMTGNYSGFWKKNSQCLITCPLDLFLSYLFMPPKYSVCVCLSWVYFGIFFSLY